MTVIQSIIGRIQPGRFDEYLELNRQAIKIHERLGVSARVFLAGPAGEASGLSSFSTEHANMDDYGRYADEVATDGELQSLVMHLRSEKTPVVIEQQSLASELPLGRTPKAGRGPVVEVHVSRPTPGRMEEVLSMGKRVCDFVEAHGALNARSFQLGYAGIGSGSLLSMWEFENLRAWGKASDAWNNDPEGQEIAMSTVAANPSTTLVFSGVYMEVPL